MNLPSHISFLNKTGTTLQTSDGKTVEVWELLHTPDSATLSAWAKHFREHFCLDSQIDTLRSGIRLSRKDYLETIKFPDATTAPDQAHALEISAKSLWRTSWNL
ncbi:hypothetical protein FACS1894158_08970 [Betaproteobacteria bacterium]|nr:hypothetical protein FACS1894158_08970 [Betaproteobacteria bacterium]